MGLEASTIWGPETNKQLTPTKVGFCLRAPPALGRTFPHTLQKWKHAQGEATNFSGTNEDGCLNPHGKKF
jgi:hypothetical protein